MSTTLSPSPVDPASPASVPVQNSVQKPVQVALRSEAGSLAAAFNQEQRTIRFSVLDDSWISRFDWTEWERYELQFEVSEAAIDVSRLGSGATGGSGDDSTVMFTDDHRDDRRIGKAIAYDITDGKLYLTCRIGVGEWADRYLSELSANVEPGKSVEVFVTETVEVEKAEYEGEGWGRKLVKPAKRRATKYTLSAISTVSTPAIGTVGFSANFGTGLSAGEFSEMEEAIAGMRSKFQQQIDSLSNQVRDLNMSTATSVQETQTLEATPAPAQTPAPAPTEAAAPAAPANNGALLEAQQRIEALEMELASQRLQRRQDGISKFLAENANRITPAMRDFSQQLSLEGGDRVVTLATFLSAQSDQMLQWFQGWVQQCFHAQVPAQTVIPPGEFAAGKTGETLSVAQLAALAKKRHQEMLSAGTPISHSQALDQVMAEHGAI